MPCAGPSEEEHRAYMRREGHFAYDPSKQELEAMLCGIVSILQWHGTLENVLNDVDWKEVGVSREFFQAWWKDHQQRDHERRAREQALEEKERKELARLKAKYDDA